MLKITCQIPKENEEELALNNICNLASTKNFMMISQSCIAWLVSHPKSNLQDLENIIREKELDLYLIATDKIEEGQILSLPNEFDDSQLKYNCVVSCKNKNNINDEILKYSSSYEENFDKLKQTGFIISEGDSFDDILQKTKDLEGLQFRLMHNKVKIELETVDPQTEFQKDIKYAHEKYGVKPVPVVVARNKETDEEIYGAVVHIGDNQDIISQYGFIKQQDKNKYLLLNDQSTW